ncbi:nitroreductase family protein [Ectopseudomonas mendocina]|uniref:Putative NAD(P)H nitroreductase n=1 Tax=Ectopseudomonas mendocina TaxID=300 RepID=A0ABZ2RKM6_ECTME
MDALVALTDRVSVPRLVAPAPDAAQRELLFQAALRAPDHGQLKPWRFLIIEGEGLVQLGELFAASLPVDSAPELLNKARNMPLRAPLMVVVIASVTEGHKVPVQEQVLAAGCAAHAMLLAAHAQGIGAVWRTGDMAYNPNVLTGLGLQANEQLVGYLYLGTPEKEPRTAPRPDITPFVKAWPLV